MLNFFKKVESKLTILRLTKFILLLVILYLLYTTSVVWGSWLDIVFKILKPFIIGFVIAFVISPVIEWMEKKGLSRTISIFLFWLIVIVLFVMLCLVLMPMIYNKISGFVGNLVEGIQWISSKILLYDQSEGVNLIRNVLKSIVEFLQSYTHWLPSIVSTIPDFMSVFIGTISSTLFSIIIAIYMLSDFGHMKRQICKFCCSFYKKSDRYLFKIEKDVSVYLKSLLILMLIKFIEYSIFYFFIGHEDWMIIAILMALGLLIPYIGGTIANMIGILTALTLPSFRLVLLIIGICILSNVDAYIISPMIHEKRSSIGPLMTLFVVFAGGVLYGGVGIMLSIPVAIAVQSIIEIYKKEKEVNV